MHTWQLQEAKSRFSELVARTLTEGPQLVTRRGEDAVIVLSAPEYQRLVNAQSLLSVLNAAPRGEPLEIKRPDEPLRELVL